MNKKLDLNTVANYLMLILLGLFSGVCFFIFSAMLISKMQGDTPSAAVPWTTLQVGIVLVITPLICKKLYVKLIFDDSAVALKPVETFFVGMLRGWLFGGTVLVLAAAYLFLFSPERFFDKALLRWVIAVLLISGAAGIVARPSTVGRKTRLWLLLTLVIQFIAISSMRSLTGLDDLKFDYRLKSCQPEKMPLLDKGLLEALVPTRATDIRVYGQRGSNAEIHLSCTVSEADFAAFCHYHKYLPQGNEKDYIRGDNKKFVFIYDPEKQILRGVFREAGVPPAPEKKVPADVSAPAVESGRSGGDLERTQYDRQ